MEKAIHAPMPMRDGLPPQDVWLYNPRTKGKLETPIDERGLVDLDQLVAMTRQTIDSNYSWTSTFNDIHHLQWYETMYPNHSNDEDGLNLHDFRELINRKAYVPRVFHNWIHSITLPPPVPSREVMQYCIDSQRVAISLAKTSSLAVRLTRKVGIPAPRLEARLEEEFIKYNTYVENARLVPLEFRLLAIEQIEAGTVEEMLDRNRLLGRLAIDRIPVRFRSVARYA